MSTPNDMSKANLDINHVSLAMFARDDFVDLTTLLSLFCTFYSASWRVGRSLQGL